jgi:hypothetical protein
MLATASVCLGQGGPVELIGDGAISTDKGLYEANADSAWHLSCPDAEHVPVLQFTAFDLETGKDFVSISLYPTSPRAADDSITNPGELRLCTRAGEGVSRPAGCGPVA